MKRALIACFGFDGYGVPGETCPLRVPCEGEHKYFVGLVSIYLFDLLFYQTFVILSFNFIYRYVTLLRCEKSGKDEDLKNGEYRDNTGTTTLSGASPSSTGSRSRFSSSASSLR